MVEGVGSFAAWHHLVDSWPIYTIGDTVAVDFVGRYETLSTDFNSLCDQLDISNPKLGSAKVAQKYDFREFSAAMVAADQPECLFSMGSGWKERAPHFAQHMVNSRA